MLSLPLVLRVEKNKLVSTAPWLLLLDVTLPDNSHRRLVKNTEDITFAGNAYAAYAFELGEIKSGSGGAVVTVQLDVFNPSQVLTPDLEAHDGFVGCSVALYVVHADNLDADYTELTLMFTVLAASPKDDRIQFTLGAENPMRRRFPLYAALPNSCVWSFKGAECAYSGPATTCDRMLQTCRNLGNTARFGGRPGILGAPKFR